MKYRFYKCSDPFVKAARERIVVIAQAAFAEIPRDEVLKRLDQYDDILIIQTECPRAEQSEGVFASIIGFNFCSSHRFDKILVVGGRLVAIHPDYKGRGYLRAASLHIFRRYYIQLLREFVTGRTRRLVIFSRQCNPIAYRLLHGGQDIFPDLINRQRSELHAPNWATDVYAFLRRDLGLKQLDIQTGIVAEGASQAGIHSAAHVSDSCWKTRWQDYVPVGAELISLIPVSPCFPLQYAHLIGRRWLRVINRQPTIASPT